MKSGAVKEMKERGYELGEMVSNGIACPAEVRRLSVAGGYMDVYYPSKKEEHPFITFGMCYGVCSDQPMDWHSHDGVEWVFVKQGVIQVQIGSDIRVVKAGQYLEIPKGERHRTEASPNCEVAIVVFPGERAY